MLSHETICSYSIWKITCGTRYQIYIPIDDYLLLTRIYSDYT